MPLHTKFFKTDQKLHRKTFSCYDYTVLIIDSLKMTSICLRAVHKVYTVEWQMKRKNHSAERRRFWHTAAKLCEYFISTVGLKKDKLQYLDSIVVKNIANYKCISILHFLLPIYITNYNQLWKISANNNYGQNRLHFPQLGFLPQG